MGSNGLKEKHINERLGEENYNKYGTLMKIKEYNSSESIIVEFQDENKYKTKCRYDQFKNGSLASPYDRTVLGIGYVGIGKYNYKNYPKIYSVWNDMLKRCYDPYWINKHLTYKDCFVEEYFHCFQNFAKWYEENYYECNNERMELDKDILKKGNKIYDREHMIFIPKRINTLFIKSDKNRGKCLIGVSWDKNSNLFRGYIRINNKQITQRFNTEIEAFEWYKKYKERYIKQVADEYRNLIPNRLYEAMYKYEVEIND